MVEENMYRYPQSATRYIAIPATSVPCERVFSTAGHIVSEKRSCLLLFFFTKTENYRDSDFSTIAQAKTQPNKFQRNSLETPLKETLCDHHETSR